MKDVQTHLSRLESDAIEIMREVVSEAQNPVMLYSVGKDSAGDAASGEKGVLTLSPSVSVNACGYHLEISRDV